MVRTGRLAAVLLLALSLAGVALAPAAARTAPGAYANPISRDVADTFADPAVIKAKDGYGYAYGTTDPLREGEGRRHIIPTARSADLVNWTYVGDAFTEDTLPAWADAAAGAALWAPDIRYLDGTCHLYYVVTQTTVTAGPNDNAIGVATAPTPTGPWTDSGDPVVDPRPGASGNPDDFRWTFDPSQFTDRDGTRYLYYGSYYGGIFVTELSEDGTEAVGEPTMVAIDNRYEGAYVVRHGRWYYLFASEANCCAGPTTGYTVFAGRSASPRGPFTDRDGSSLLDSRVGGDAPDGAYTVETRLAIDLGTDEVRNFQQAGLIAYLDDDHFLRLSHVAIWNTRQTEFFKEQPFADRVSFGGMAVGTPAPVTWLRLRHRVDPANGEHEFRAATSRDGRRWTWGGVWTLPAGTRPRIGLISHGGAGAVAEFDHVRIYQP